MGLKTKRWAVVGIVGALALTVGACGDDDEGDSAAGGGESAAPLKIGASLPLTGEFSEPGKAAKQGYEVWAGDGQRRAAA